MSLLLKKRAPEHKIERERISVFLLGANSNGSHKSVRKKKRPEIRIIQKLELPQSQSGFNL